MNEANEHTPLRLAPVATLAEVTPAAERVRRRRIGLHHMAFIRGVYEGLDVGALAEQYLGNLGDRRRARSTLRWLVDELANAARKRGDSAGARLLRLPTAKLLDAPPDSDVRHAARATFASESTPLTVSSAPTSSGMSAGATLESERSRAAVPTGTDRVPMRAPIDDATQDPIALSALTAGSDTLEAFRDAHDPEGVYSEAELIALYEESREATRPVAQAIRVSDTDRAADQARSSAVEGATRPLPSRAGVDEHAMVMRATRLRARNQRLRTRRRALLDRLEAALVEPPRLHHFIGDWIDPALAQRLEAIDIRTVGDLLSLINRRGFHWYRDVPRVGLRAAHRLQDWLAMNAADLGGQIARHAAMPRRQWSAPIAAGRRVTSEHIAAIEYFTPQDARVGADRDALVQLLDRYKHSASTYRCFRLQAERLLLWTALRKQCALVDLTDNDAHEYFAFMQAPDPEWCGPKVERGLPAWRPFEGPSSAASVHIARRALKALFAQLVVEGVVSRNPFAARLLPPTPASPRLERNGQRPRVLQSLEIKPSDGRMPLPIHLARMRLLAYVVDVAGMPMPDAAALRVKQVAGLWTVGETRLEVASDLAHPGITETQRQSLRALLADYLTLREAQSGSVDPDAPLFVRHTATGIDETTKVPFMPAGTLVRVLARYRALCHGRI